MASLNKVMLIGNVTRDPEIRYTPKGTALVELGLAVNRNYTADNGERREEVTFVDVTMWGRTAEIANEYLRKGRPVFIEGRLQLDSWEDKQTGQKRSRMRVVCEGMQLLGGREGGGSGGGSREGGGQYSREEGRSYGGGGGGAREPRGGGNPGGGSGDDYPEDSRSSRYEGGGGGGGGRQQPSPRPMGRPAAAPKPPVDPDLDVEEDDIPF